MTRRDHRGIVLPTVLALATLAFACADPGLGELRETITLPSNFTDSLVASVTNPTAMAFLPDGTLLVTSQSGTVRVVKNGQLLTTPAVNLASRICTNSERGVLGIAVDPSFASTRLVYLYYTFNKSSSCANNAPTSGPVNRVSSFTYRTDDTIDTGTEKVLVDNILSLGGNHNGGDIHFGRDGYLYISIGDSGCQLNDSSKCGGGNTNARYSSIVNGKILRVRADTGAAAPGNPWLGEPGNVRCGTPGNRPSYSLNNNAPCNETFASGLRNPFRFSFKPNSDQFFINDVGQNLYEEIDDGALGLNYGWPTREGNCANGSTTNCGAPPAGMTNPIYTYGRSEGCVSITGGAFVPAGVFGTSFDGSYLFGDYGCGKIFKLTKSGNTYSASNFATSMGSSSVTSMLFGPASNGNTALYYTTYGGNGQIRRIAFTGNANRPPVAVIDATPTSGPLPLTVSFDGGDSSDPDGDALTYQWDSGNGQTRTTSGSTTTFTYSATGTFTATLVVKDSKGASSQAATVVIHAGNAAPTATITAPAEGAKFAVDQTITLTGSATDPEDGNLPASRLSWEVLRHHAEHTHPYFGPTTGNNLTFPAPPPEDLLAAGNSWLEIKLTATDTGGSISMVTRRFDARTVALTFASTPSGRQLILDSTTTVTTPATVTSWDHWGLRVNAPDQTDGAGTRWTFQSWSDGGAADHVVTTPTAARTYTATFTSGGTRLNAKINFQPNDGNVPAGYVADTGAAYGARGGGLTYGWNATNVETRRRGVNSDLRYDTLIHLQKPSSPNASWEIAVPNGSYQVHVVMGDPDHNDSNFRLNAEGRLIASGDPTPTSRFVEATATVTVTDGRLTLSNGAGAANNKLAFVDIAQQ